MNWQDVGWKIDVNFVEMTNKIRPKNHIDILRGVLPDRYSPLQATGNGNQGVYLTEVPMNLAQALIGLIGRQAAEVADTTVEHLQLARQPRKRPRLRFGSITSSRLSNKMLL